MSSREESLMRTIFFRKSQLGLQNGCDDIDGSNFGSQRDITSSREGGGGGGGMMNEGISIVRVKRK